jgi:putative Mg2+ transporter-C (MgtC) family protein
MSFLDIGLRFILAIAAGGAIGYEREAHHHPAGLRTHILVCAGAAMVAIIECMLAEGVVQLSAQSNPVVTVTLGRLSAQVISGIGFLGAGTIIITKRSVAGLTTAASLWMVACIGISAGMGLYTLCALGAGTTLIVLAVIKRLVKGHSHRMVEIVFTRRQETLNLLHEYFTAQRIRVRSVECRAEAEEAEGDGTGSGAEASMLYTNLYTLDTPDKLGDAVITGDISEFPGIRKIRVRSQ